MELKKNAIVKNIPDYVIERKEFNEIMANKKVMNRYDKKGVKKVELSQDKGMVSGGNHKPERIRSEYLTGPFVIVFLTTKAEADPENPDSYVHTATLIFDEDDAVRVYRDSLNDGFDEARFCDDTVMLMAVKSRKNSDDKHYIKVDGEPTGYGSWKFESTEGENKNNSKMIKKYMTDTAAQYKLTEDKVFVVIQLK